MEGLLMLCIFSQPFFTKIRKVPWGKHSPAGDKEFREKHKTLKDKDVDALEIMPMVTIRDPLVWLKSMCRHKYTAHWLGFQAKVCPNFFLDDLEIKVKYDGFFRTYESLIHLWNDYYNDYKNIDIPFLLVRFEDLVFHAEETTRRVCECGGGVIYAKQFRYIVDSAKHGTAAHGKMSDRTGYVDALIRYGTLAKRYKGWDSAENLKYVKDNIDPKLMEMMQYAPIDPHWTEVDNKGGDKIEGKADDKGGDKTEDKADDDAKDKTDDDAKDKAEDDAKDKIDDDSKDIVNDDAKDKTDDDAKDKTDDNSKDKIVDDAKDKIDDDAKDKTDDDAKDKTDDDAKDKTDDDAKDKAKDKAENNAKDIVDDDANDKTEDNPKDKTDDNEKDKTDDDVKDKTDDDAEDKADDDAKEKN